MVVYGPLPPNAESYNVEPILAHEEQQLPIAAAGFGYGVIFDVRESRVTVQFGTSMHTILESDIFDRFSLFKTGLMNVPEDLRDEFMQ